MTYLAIALGSALGGASRYAVVRTLQRHGRGTFPLGTISVNISGCLLAGLLIGLLATRGLTGGTTEALLIIGFCGSYTTVSTFSLDTLTLIQTGQRSLAALNIAGSVLGTLAGAVCGFLLAGISGGSA